MSTPSSTEAGLLFRIAKPFVLVVERFYPDPFLFVIVLTFVAFSAALGLTDTTPRVALKAWGQGLSSLMAFTAQVAITLITAHAVARTNAVERGLAAIAALPRSSHQAYSMVALVSGLASLVAWPLGLIVGATLAKRLAVAGKARQLRLDYPLLVASAYSGFVVWHMGYSGSAPLFVATPGHALENAVGLIPVAETIFSAWNLVIAGTVLIVVSVTCSLMQPPADRIRPLEAGALEQIGSQSPAPPANGPPTPQEATFGDRLTHSKLGSFALGALLFTYLAFWFAEMGFSLNLNIVNWSFLAAGLLLTKSPAHYVSLVLEGGRSLGSLLLQYPFYAGIMGLLAGSGLIGILSDAIAAQSTAATLPVWAFLSGGLVNFFVPSGGGQWAIQGPIFLDAAKALGVDPALVVMGVAYGDQWTNMIQPFWTIPLLAIAGLKVRDILGYTFVTLIVTGLLFGGGLYLAGLFVAGR